MKKRIQRFIEKVVKTILRPEMRILPGQLAFFFVLSIIPLVAIIGSIAGQFQIPLAELEVTLSKVIPSQVVDMILPILTAKEVGVNMIIFYASALLLASNGTHSMIIASNSIYHFEDKNYLLSRAKALLMTIILVLLLVFVLLVPAFGDQIVNSILLFISNAKINSFVLTVYHFLKYPLSLFLIYLLIKALYFLAPDGKVKAKEMTPGALVASFGWLIATEIYSIYVDMFMNYDVFYGSIANILILMFWVYLLAYIFVLGMAFNVREED